MRLKTQKKERGKWKGGNAIKTATDDIINYIEVYLKKNGVSRNMNGEYS